ncbi:MAG: competence protein ComEC [Solirubrobacteraceae bacterium]|nr:competence protein ComEC [Solirubrobacteraceae bacterium]
MRTRALTALAVARDHPRHVILGALVAGLICGCWAPDWAALPALVALAVGGRPVLGLAAVATVLVGAVIGVGRREAIDTGRLPAAIGASVRASMTLLEPLHERASGQLVARARTADGEPLLLRLEDRSRLAGDIEPGDIVAVDGWLAELERYDTIQRRRGALAGIEVTTLRPTGRRRGGLAGVLDGVRRRAEAALARGLPREQAALLQGMVLGRDDRIPAETREVWQASGLTHLLAVSGTNVMLLALLVLGAGAVLGVPLRARLVAALVLVALYVPLTGAGPSIQRAGVMGAAGLVAALAGRPASRWYALLLAAAVTLALNPYAAAEAGWQLSFAAVAGLLWLGPPIRLALERARVPRGVAEAAALTVAATLTTAPLLAVHFGRVSLVSLPANLVAAPVVAPVMWLGMLAAAVGQVGPVAAGPLTVVDGWLVGFLDDVARAAAAVPHAVATVRLPGIGGALVGYGLLVAGWLALREARRRRVLAPACAIVAAAIAVLLLSGRGPSPAAPRPGETLVSFLDIGQGDATLVQRDGAAVLVDTGPPEGQVVARLRAVGLRRLDALVLTHAQRDHEGAAITVLEHFRPRLVIDGGAGWPTPVQEALPREAAATGARIIRVAAGDVVGLGVLRLQVLSPPPAIAALPPEGDPNNRALVIHLRSGWFDLLLTADAESDVTGGLALPDVDALKVAHHGSADTGLPRELVQLRPEVATIEVGRHNTYGHPAPSTLAALRRVPNVFRTDRDGTVRLHALGGRMTVERLGARS